jgi:hypothetical protein
MVSHLHKEFSLDRERYDAAVNYWRVLCEEILRRKGQLGSWQPWCGIHQSGATAPLEEGSIYSLHSQAQKKAINIEQYRPNTRDVEISAMVDTFGDGALESPIQYLTICCALSEESAEIARRLIETWVGEQTTVTDIQGLIAELIP